MFEKLRKFISNSYYWLRYRFSSLETMNHTLVNESQQARPNFEKIKILLSFLYAKSKHSTFYTREISSMTDLPNQNLNKAIAGKLYLSENGTQYAFRGPNNIVYTGMALK